MIKRILVALDPDYDTPVATRYAIELAGRFDAEVSGLAVVDTKHIAAAVGPGGAIGGLYYAEQVRQSLSEQTRASAEKLVADFEAGLRAAGVRHGERIEEGVPARRIIEDMKYHDLLVIGSTPHFYYANPEKETKTLVEVVKRGIAPSLVVGDRYEDVERVVVGYDGSDAAARTLQRFAHLSPFGKHLEVDVVHIRPSEAGRAMQASELLVRLAGSYLRAHGFEHVVETSRYGDSPARQLVEHANTTGADLIVAGTHSVTAARRLVFGSTTHSLLMDCGVALFLFH